MSAKSRSKKCLELPLKRTDYITVMTPSDDRVIIGTNEGRYFVMTPVKGYKRPYKVREIHR